MTLIKHNAYWLILTALTSCVYPPTNIMRISCILQQLSSTLFLGSFTCTQMYPLWQKNMFGNAQANCPYPSHPVHHSCFQWHTLLLADGYQNPFESNRVQCESSWVSGSGWNYHINAICECWATSMSVMRLPQSRDIKLRWCHRWQSVGGTAWVWGGSEWAYMTKWLIH